MTTYIIFMTFINKQDITEQRLLCNYKCQELFKNQHGYNLLCFFTGNVPLHLSLININLKANFSLAYCVAELFMDFFAIYYYVKLSYKFPTKL